MHPEELFDCKQCGQCCQGFGGTYVSPREIEAIAAFCKMDSKRFVNSYCRLSGTKPVIAQGRDGFCVFFDTQKLCRIHPVKPRMCKDWPFIDSILVDVINWRSMAASCPGMRTDVSDGQIINCVRKVIASRNQAAR